MQEPGLNPGLPIPKPRPFPWPSRSSACLNSSCGKSTVKKLRLRKWEQSGLSMFFSAAWLLCILLQLVLGNRQLIMLADCFELSSLFWTDRGEWWVASRHNCTSCFSDSQVRLTGQEAQQTSGSRGFQKLAVEHRNSPFQFPLCLSESQERANDFPILSIVREDACAENVVAAKISHWLMGLNPCLEGFQHGAGPLPDPEGSDNHDV